MSNWEDMIYAGSLEKNVDRGKLEARCKSRECSSEYAHLGKLKHVDRYTDFCPNCGSSLVWNVVYKGRARKRIKELND